jgi:hypothetical protein
MNLEQLNNSKVPIIVFDKKLEKFRGKTLFPEKLAKANEILAKAALPKAKK